MRTRIEELPVAVPRRIAAETPFVALIRSIERADEAENVRHTEREVRHRLRTKELFLMRKL